MSWVTVNLGVCCYFRMCTQYTFLTQRTPTAFPALGLLLPLSKHILERHLLWGLDRHLRSCQKRKRGDLFIITGPRGTVTTANVRIGAARGELSPEGWVFKKTVR